MAGIVWLTGHSKVGHAAANQARSSCVLPTSLRDPVAPRVAMRFAKRFVYVIRNEWERPRYYTGVTSHVASGVRAHNAGLCAATAAARPWTLDLVIAFPDEQRALAFEAI